MSWGFCPKEQSVKAVIIGSGTSGKGVAKLLKKLRFDTYLIDEKKVRLSEKVSDKLLQNLDLLVLSPGVSIENSFVQKAKAQKVEVASELEVGARMLACPFIAVTGTNGKTTTVSLIDKLLSPVEDGKVYEGGNIGIAVSSFSHETKKQDKVVLEVSSFQLEATSFFRPKVATILNISQDHLNRHKTMQNYIDTKLKILKDQTSKDFAILNLDDEILCEQDLSFVKSQIYYFSTKNECKGCYCKNGCIYFNDGVISRFVMRTCDIPIQGEHNLSNVLAGLCSVILFGEKIEGLAEKVKAFKGISHRLEFVSEIGGITFINDSKATNISSTIVAIKAMREPTTLILGGSDKGFEYDELFENFSPIIKNIVAVGETKDKIVKCAKKFNVINVYEAKTFKEAVFLSFSLANENETVLLSPAAASFDMFSNFEERGRVFVKIVREIAKIENRKIRNQKTKRHQN